MKNRLMVLMAFAGVVFRTGSVAALPADNSCVDLGNDGVCDPSDPPLAPLLADGRFDSGAREAGYSLIPGARVGVVFDNFVVPRAGSVRLRVSGNVVFRHRVTGKGADGRFDVQTDGAILFEEKALLRLGADVTLRAPSIDVGTRAEILAAQNTSDLVIEADTLTTRELATFAAPGHEGSLVVRANRLVLGERTYFQADQRARLQITTYGDLFAKNLRIYAGDVLIEALSSAVSPGPRVVELTDSVVRQSYPRGKIDVYAGMEGRTGHTPGDAITFIGGGVKSQTVGREYFDPAATFVRNSRRRVLPLR